MSAGANETIVDFDPTSEVSLQPTPDKLKEIEEQTSTLLRNRSISVTSSEHERRIVKRWCDCDDGWLFCLVYGCVDLNCCCCCPCDCYIYMGWSVLMYVGFTFIYEIYILAAHEITAGWYEKSVYLFEIIFVDFPIIIIVWFDKVKYLKYTFITQILCTIGHILLMIVYFMKGDEYNGWMMATLDVPFEIILIFVLIPFYLKTIPLWERRNDDYFGIMSPNNDDNVDDNGGGDDEAKKLKQKEKDLEINE